MLSTLAVGGGTSGCMCDGCVNVRGDSGPQGHNSNVSVLTPPS